MSEKEKIVQLLNQVPEYLEDTDPGKDEIFTLDECKKEWGLA